jgi:SpoVK/Ycf46/Vps4 family AAA+-type ATPase
MPADADTTFTGNGDHLFAELRRLDLLLRRAVLVARAARAGEDPAEFRGLVVSEENVDRMLESFDFLAEPWKSDGKTQSQLDAADRAIEKKRAEINIRLQNAKQQGKRLALPRLAALCGLSAAEVDLLLVALAPELDPRYETLYSYLQNDVTRKRPSADLALNLVCRSKEEKLRARALLSPGAPLLHFGIIELVEEAYDRQATQLRQFLKLDSGVVLYLLDQPPTSLPGSSFRSQQIDIQDLAIATESRVQLEGLAASLERSGTEHTIIHLTGDGTTSLDEAAGAIAHAMGRVLSVLDLGQPELNPHNFSTVVRDAALWDAVIAIYLAAPRPTEAEQQRADFQERTLWIRLRESSSPVIVIGANLDYGNLPNGARIWRVVVKAPDYEVRKGIWDETLAGSVPDADLSRLADIFPFPAARIHQITGLAFSEAALRNPSNPAPDMNDLLAAGRSLSTPNIRRFAIPIQPVHDWNDLVLPPDRLRQLKLVEARVKNRHVVLRDWGFGKKLSRGRGIAILCTGAPGTGKTLAAEVLANALSLDLFQIDLSTVVSKFIGESEKILSIIFQEAEQSQSLLFFDEADALFGKRTEVKDAHDRYANIEVNYLLQRIEQYEGLVVLATNFQKNLDEAFVRRLQDVIEFPFPDEISREKIWRSQFANPDILTDDVNLAYLGSQFKMTGGNIRNAALNAAFLAAGENPAKPQIRMQHLVSAIRREFQKQGRLVMKSDLGQYAYALEEAQ